MCNSQNSNSCVCFFTASVSSCSWHIHKCYISQALQIQMPAMNGKIIIERLGQQFHNGLLSYIRSSEAYFARQLDMWEYSSFSWKNSLFLISFETFDHLCIFSLPSFGRDVSTSINFLLYCEKNNSRSRMIMATDSQPQGWGAIENMMVTGMMESGCPRSTRQFFSQWLPCSKAQLLDEDKQKSGFLCEIVFSKYYGDIQQRQNKLHLEPHTTYRPSSWDSGIYHKR